MDELANAPTQQVEKWAQDWKTHLVEYEKHNNRKAIREAKRIIKECEDELKSRSAALQKSWFYCENCKQALCDLCAECHCIEICEQAIEECEE